MYHTMETPKIHDGGLHRTNAAIRRRVSVPQAAMAVLSVLLEACGLLGFTWWLLGRYRDPYVSAVGQAAVFLSWSLGFLGLLLLPIDIAKHGGTHPWGRTSEEEDDGDDNSNNGAIGDLPSYLHLWQALYWLTFLLSWIVLPLLVEFSQNGEFDVSARLLSSTRRIVLHWTIVVVVVSAAVVYLLVVGHFTVQGLVGLAMAAANTYGLVWIILLLGHGLVDIPRSLWKHRTPELWLRDLHFRAVQVHNERMEAIFLYQDILREVHNTYDSMLQAESVSIILTSDMQQVKAGLNTVMALVETDHRDPESGGFSAKNMAKPKSSASPMLSTSTISESAPAYMMVVELHRRVKSAQSDLRGSEQAWVELCTTADALQRAIGRNVAAPPAGIYSTTNMMGQLRVLAGQTQSQLQRVLLPHMYAIASLVCALASVCIVWGELTMSWSSIYSPSHVFGLQSTTSVEMAAFALLLYMVLCAYTSLFKLRSFGRFALRGHRNSSELALLKTAIHQCRLQFAIGYNFLLLVHEPRLTDSTAFHQLWSNMQVIRVFGRDFSVYAPILMIVLAGCTVSNVYARLMKAAIGMEQYEQLLPGHPDHEGQVTKGERLVQKGIGKLRREEAKLQKRHSQWRGRGVLFTDKAMPEMATSLLDSHHEDSGDDDVAGVT